MRGGVVLGAGLGLAGLCGLGAAMASAELPVETVGRVEGLPSPLPPHWVWVGDPILHRLALVDVDEGRLRGMISAGYGIPRALFPPERDEIYVPETHYSRGSRGERADVLTVYDSVSLAPVAEVPLPPKRALNAVPVGNAALSDDGRFAAVFNMTPATSLSIVDLEGRRFAAEIATPGCGMVYAAGPRRFVLPCMDGALLVVELDPSGAEAGKRRTRSFFDPESDPVTEKAVRAGGRWLFVSFEGYLHEVEVSGAEPGFAEPWSLFDAAERAEGWRIGGAQHLAVHEASGRLYALVHRGGPDGHKEPGSEVWVYDLASRRRTLRIELVSPGLTYLGSPIEPARDRVWLARLWDWLLESPRFPRTDAITVTPDAEPRLVAVNLFSGALAAYDARSGAFLRRVYTGNLSSVGVQAPGPPGRSEG
jgi:methylamine dehydrogenase heavy chain